MNETEIRRWVNFSVIPIESPWLDGLYEQVKSNVSTRLNYYRFLYHLVRETQPEVSIELGVEFGLASAHMALAAREYGGMVIGVDINGHGIPKVQIPAECPNYHFMQGNSTNINTVAQVMWIAGYHPGKYSDPFGLIFQDSSHHYAPSVKEWEIYSPRCKPGAIWVCDDVTPDFYEEGVDEKSMVDYFDERPARLKLKFPDVLHKGNTIGIMVL